MSGRLPRPTGTDEVLGPVRTCPRCKEDWPLDEEFYYPGYYICRACERERQRQKWAQRRAA